jgi:hypothetical protein
MRGSSFLLVPLPRPPAFYLWWVKTPGNTQRGQTDAIIGANQRSAAAFAVTVEVVVFTE